ncbi:MAG: UvrD-helicase domain-containing protein [Succinivibrio sp.]|nr:UvrD-helicase domain-containing protein [Succinivibrio sp.]
MLLNDAQQQAVDYIDGPCLVLAGAGSGKTRVITTKIVTLIRKHGIPPERIGAVTFTNKAAAEMRERVSRELGTEAARQIVISTFHSLGLQILQKEHRRVNLGKHFSLFDEYDSQKIIGDIIKDEFPGLIEKSSERSVVEEYAVTIARLKSKMLSPEDLHQDQVRTQIYALYEEYLQACNAIDFEDLIFKTTKLLRTDPEAGERWCNWFRYMLVDEYQDTNDTQYELLKLLTRGSNRFTVVGDDDQSIYAWRGASPQNIDKLSKEYSNLKVIKLEQNYRSTGHILKCANGLIAYNDHLYTKRLYTDLGDGSKVYVRTHRDEQDEAAFIVSEIYGMHYERKCRWNDFAVLYRGNFQSRLLEKEFRQARIPVVISGGSSFFEQREVKDVMAWCRLICNPHDDVALLRIINIPRRGIGTETLSILSDAARKTGLSLYACATDAAITRNLLEKQKKSLSEFIRLVVRLRQCFLSYEDEKLANNLLSLVEYERYIEASTDSKAAKSFRLANAQMLMSWIQDMVKGGREEEPLSFDAAVDKLGLREMMNRQNDGADADAVQLMTLHASKGLEFPYVYLIGFEEGVLPHRNSFDVRGGIAEERRLAYVGITRARRELNLCRCLYLGTGLNKSPTLPSRFLDELPAENIVKVRMGEDVKSYDSKKMNEDFLSSMADSLFSQMEQVRKKR